MDNNRSNKILDTIINIEIFLFLPRIVFYIVNELFPFRIAGLPFITLTLVISLLGYVVYVLHATEFPKTSFISLIVILFIILVDSYSGSLRDVFAEVQGYIIFIIDYELFRNKATRLLATMKKIIILLSVEILILGGILLVNPSLLPLGVLAGNRYEGFFTSSVLLILVPFSIMLLFKPGKDRFAGTIGIVASLFLMLLTVTKSTIIASFIAATYLIIMYIRQGLAKKYTLVIIAVAFVIFISNINSLKNTVIGDNIELLTVRFEKLANEKTKIDEYRLIEQTRELAIFTDNPFWGKGFGLRYKINLWGKDFFGHNFYTSFLARKGLVGFILILILFFSIARNISYHRNLISVNHEKIWLALKATFISSFFVLAIANFSYYLSLGIFGAFIGLVESAFKNEVFLEE